MKKIEREVLDKAMVAGGCCKSPSTGGGTGGGGLIP